MNREVVSSNIFKLIDVTPLSNILTSIKFQNENYTTLQFEDKENDSLNNETDENLKETEEDEAEPEKKISMLNRHGSSISLQQKSPKLKIGKPKEAMYESLANLPQSAQYRNRAAPIKKEVRPYKRPMSSYGGKQDYESGPVKRIPSSTSSRQHKYNFDRKDTNKSKEIPHPHSSRYTPKSKDRREESNNSFVNDNRRPAKGGGSFLANSTENPVTLSGVKGPNSNAGDVVTPQIDEEEEKRLIQENPLRKRVFLHIAQTSSSVQVAWSHSSKTKSDKRIHYVLEYGVGIKMNGEEQFRMIYNGRAHKCIITDLMPRTSYRFKVIPCKLDENNKEVLGECSDIKQINTYDNQDIHPNSLGHHANIIMK